MLIGIEKVYRLGWGRQDVAPAAQVHRAQRNYTDSCYARQICMLILDFGAVRILLIKLYRLIFVSQFHFIMCPLEWFAFTALGD